MDFITLENGPMSIELWTLGARLNQASFGAFTNLLDGSTSEEEARGPKLNHGSVAGPVANRLAGGRAEINGTLYGFERDENGKTLLHSGSKSTRDALWSVGSRSDHALELTLEIADMADDFPGNRRITAQYEVVEDGFDLSFRATSDAPTLMNLALHPYWRLDAGGRDGLRLQVAADSYLAVDQDKIPLGAPYPVENSLYDLRALAVPSYDIDHNYCLAPSDDPAVVLASDNLEPFDHHRRAGDANLYRQALSASRLNPSTGRMRRTSRNFHSILLEPGQTYAQTSRYRFAKL